MRRDLTMPASALFRFVMALAWGVLSPAVSAADEPVVRQPLFRVADLNTGESQDIELSNGKRVTLKLLGVEETRDNLRSAVRLARVKVEVHGAVATIESGNYRLPVTVGEVQIDCPATQGLYRRHDLFEDSWGLDKEARLRLWPKGSPWIEPGTFGYPIRQRWFANVTQAGNEPSYVMATTLRRRAISTTTPETTSAAWRGSIRCLPPATGSSFPRAGKRSPSIPICRSISSRATRLSMLLTLMAGFTGTRT
jgi:hypothetical protein